MSPGGGEDTTSVLRGNLPNTEDVRSSHCQRGQCDQSADLQVSALPEAEVEHAGPHHIPVRTF